MRAPHVPGRERRAVEPHGRDAAAGVPYHAVHSGHWLACAKPGRVAPAGQHEHGDLPRGFPHCVTDPDAHWLPIVAGPHALGHIADADLYRPEPMANNADRGSVATRLPPAQSVRPAIVFPAGQAARDARGPRAPAAVNR